MEWLLSMITAVPALTWLYACVLLPWKLSSLPRLSMLPAEYAQLPRLSVVVAARNEARNIEAALSSVLSQDYPALEVVVVNDRSTDETGDILREMERHDERLRVIHVDALPDDWLGKNHALHRGFEATRGEYVLFTDADVHFKPRALRRAAGHMHDAKLDHLVSLPMLINTQPSMRAVMPAFSVFFLMTTQPWQFGNPDSKRHIGVGAFNLVRRTALENAGGFGPISLRPDDDLRLGELLKMSGARGGFVRADSELAVEWYATAGETVRGLEKNAFAHFDYRPLATTSLMLLTLYLTLMPFAGLALLPTFAGWLSLTGIVAMLALAMRVAHNIHLAPGWGLLFPFGGLCVIYATLRSMWLTLARGGIIWRDTFYPLDRLKEKSS